MFFCQVNKGGRHLTGSQGVQLINDVPTFGGFCDTFLTQLKDEFIKTPTLVVPTSLTGGLRGVDLDDVHFLINTRGSLLNSPTRTRPYARSSMKRSIYVV